MTSNIYSKFSQEFFRDIPSYFKIIGLTGRTLINAVESYDPKKGGDVMVSAKKENHNLILNQWHKMC